MPVQRVTIAEAVISAGRVRFTIQSIDPVNAHRLEEASRRLAPQRSVRDGVYTEAQSRRGEAVYFTSCSLCHKPAMTGLEVVPPLVGEAFLSRWNTRTAGDLFEWIRKSMPFGNTPKLSDPEYADVLSYILSRNGFRAGDAELVADFATLAEIRMALAAD